MSRKKTTFTQNIANGSIGSGSFTQTLGRVKDDENVTFIRNVFNNDGSVVTTVNGVRVSEEESKRVNRVVCKGSVVENHF